MLKRPSKGVTSGVGSPTKMEGRNGDLTIRKTRDGKILYVKEHNSWHAVNTGVDVAQLKKDVDRLISSVNTLRNDNNPFPYKRSLRIAESDGTGVLLKNDSGVMKVRNLADTDDAVLSAKTVKLKITEAFDFATLTEGSLIYDASTELFIAQASGMYLLNNLEAGAHSVQLRMATSDADAATVYMEGASTVWSVGFDYSDKLNFKIQPDFVFNTTDYGFTLSSAYSAGDCGGQATFTTINRNTGDITVKSLHLDLDQTAITGTGDTANNIGLDLDINCESVTQVGTVHNTGIDMDLTADTNGFSETNLGMDIVCTGAHINQGINITVTDNALDYHIRMFAGDDTGDFATLKVADTGDLTIATKDDSAIAGDIILDADGAVEINADAGNISFKDATADLFYIAAGRFDSYYDASNHVRYTVASDGAHAITVTGSVAGSASYTVTSGGLINLDAGRSLTLDAGDGAFLVKNTGTEFSVANSAYAGMILGYTTVGIDAASDSYTVTGSYAVTDSAHKVTFKAPPSGAVEIEVNFNIITIAQRKLFLGLSDNSTYAAISFPNATDVTNEHIIGDIEIYAFATELSHKWVVTGLTPNDVYTWYLGAKAEQSSRITMHWGGNAGDEFAPFIMKATALPTAVADYAVYG